MPYLSLTTTITKQILRVTFCISFSQNSLIFNLYNQYSDNGFNNVANLNPKNSRIMFFLMRRIKLDKDLK